MPFARMRGLLFAAFLACCASPAWAGPLAGIDVQASDPASPAMIAAASGPFSNRFPPVPDLAAASTPGPVDRLSSGVAHLREMLVDFAVTLRDIRYRRGGREPATGFDCSGFVRYVFAHAVGLQLPTNSASQFLAGLKVNRADMKPGDLVFFHTHGKSRISHVGIYISDGRFIHSPASGKSVEISSLNEAYWAKRFAGAKRPEGIAQVASKG